jgi:MFS transporter, SP family, sugar:H+ symporter
MRLILCMQESTPARYRGLMISVFQSWTSLGSLVGTVIDNATHSLPGKDSYLIPLGVIYVIPVLMSVGLFFIPESPRWLLYMDRNEQARKSLLWLRPCKDAVQEEIDDIQAAILAEKEMATGVGIVDILKNPVDRRRLLLSVAAVSIQAASGAMFMIGMLDTLLFLLYASNC